MVLPDQLAQILRVKPRRQRRRADEIAKHHRQLPALGLGWCRGITVCDGHGSSGCLSAEPGDGVEQSPAVADQADAEILQVLGRQARQYPLVDLVRVERRLVLLEPEIPQPFCDIHRPLFHPKDYRLPPAGAHARSAWRPGSAAGQQARPHQERRRLSGAAGWVSPLKMVP